MYRSLVTNPVVSMFLSPYVPGRVQNHDPKKKDKGRGGPVVSEVVETPNNHDSTYRTWYHNRHPQKHLVKLIHSHVRTLSVSGGTDSRGTYYTSGDLSV